MDYSAPNRVDPCAVVRHLSHELRQPLSVLESISYLMRLRADGGKTPRQLDQVVDHVNRVIENAVHFVGAAPLRETHFDFKERLAEALAANFSEAEPHLTIDFEPGVAWIRADAHQIDRMLSCLLTGFQRLARRTRQALLRLSIGGGCVQVELLAPDLFFDAHALEREMEPFGSLACAAKIAVGNGGRAEVRSVAGYGTSLTTAFPLSRPY